MTLIYKFIRGHFTPFDDRHSVSKIWARLNQGEKRYATDKDFTYNSDMTLSLDLETWFKVTAHPLLYPKTLYRWSLSQVGPPGEKICPRQAISEWQTDRKTDGLITIGRPQSKALIIFDRSNFWFLSFDFQTYTETLNITMRYNSGCNNHLKLGWREFKNWSLILLIIYILIR